MSVGDVEKNIMLIFLVYLLLALIQVPFILSNAGAVFHGDYNAIWLMAISSFACGWCCAFAALRVVRAIWVHNNA